MFVLLNSFAVFGLLVAVVYGKNRGNLRGKRGNLHQYHDDEGNMNYNGSNRTSDRWNYEKLWIEFDNDCANGVFETVKEAYDDLVDDFADCLFEDRIKHRKNIYYNKKTDSYHGYVMIKESGCEDNLEIDYDYYCIEMFDYESVLKPVTIDPNVYCQETSISNNLLWQFNFIGDSSASGKYNDITGGSNDIDVYILDTGVLSTHTEFTETTVINLDTSYTMLTSDHGTHVAGSAAGKNVGIFKNPSRIYWYNACRLSSGSCSYQDIEDGLKAFDNQLATNKASNPSRRGVINISLAGTSNVTWKNWYESLFDDINDNGGIVVVAAGNDGKSVCNAFAGEYVVPASADNAITVGSFDSSSNVAGSSNYGSCVDVYGPGVDIYSSISSDTSSYGIGSGTSMASPNIAGLVAELLYVDPDLTFDTIRDIVSSYTNPLNLNSCKNDIASERQCYGIKISCNEIINHVSCDQAAGLTTNKFYRWYWGGHVTDHFYTTSTAEPHSSLGYVSEGYMGYLWASQVTDLTVPLYRYYSGSILDHFYTTNWGELGDASHTSAWNYEGVQGYIMARMCPSVNTPLYRYYHPHTDHFYTTNWNELGDASQSAWVYEGIAGYVSKY